MSIHSLIGPSGREERSKTDWLGLTSPIGWGPKTEAVHDYLRLSDTNDLV
jgi:hypothetical protein